MMIDVDMTCDEIIQKLLFRVKPNITVQYSHAYTKPWGYMDASLPAKVF